MKITPVCTLLCLSFVLTASAGSERFQRKGHIQNDMGGKCTYTQTVDEHSKHFHGTLEGVTGTITFDDPACMADSGVGLETNQMMINNVIARWYSHSDAAFRTKAAQLYPTSLLQKKGKCMQSGRYAAVGVTVDYLVKGDSITGVIHGSSVQGCKR